MSVQTHLRADVPSPVVAAVLLLVQEQGMRTSSQRKSHMNMAGRAHISYICFNSQKYDLENLEDGRIKKEARKAMTV